MEQTWNVKVFYDGACPLCMREISWLRKRTGDVSVSYEDTSAPDFSQSDYYKFYRHDTDLMQGLLPGDKPIQGVEVFRQLYKQAGLGWLLAPTGWPILKPCFDFAYKIFAKYRKTITGQVCKDDSCGR